MKINGYALIVVIELVCAFPFPAILKGQGNREERQVPQSIAAEESDAIVAVGQWDHSSAVSDGGGGSLDWLHSYRPGKTVSVGLGTYGFGSSHWTLARAGASFQVADRWHIEPQVALGGGSTGGSDFLYQQYRAKVLFRTSSRLYVKAQEEYIDISDSRGHLVSVGTSVFPSRLFSMDVNYAHSVGGNLGTRFVSGRLDFNVRNFRPLAGFAVGQTAPAVFGVGVGQQLVSQDFYEGFVGLGFPISGAELTVAVDWIQVGSTQRSTVTAGLRVPIGNRTSFRSAP
jgi:hypothetical protein